MPADDPRLLRCRVERSNAGMTLLDYLVARFRYLTRPAWRKEITAERVWVDGQVGSCAQPLAVRTQIAWLRLAKEPEVRRDIPVLDQGDGWIAVNKPPHLPVHADGPFRANTMVHMLSQQYGEVSLVHRLDRETSGCMVVATSQAAREHFAKQFRDGLAKKTYAAVVLGQPPDIVEVNAPIGHAAHSAISLRRSAAPDAKDPQPARTRIQVLARGEKHAAVLCQPFTGRTHQVRVHLEHLGTPVFGDKLYGHDDAHYLDFVERVKAGEDAMRAHDPGEPHRHLLHALELQLQLPDGTQRSFIAPIPLDFAGWDAQLGILW